MSSRVVDMAALGGLGVLFFYVLVAGKELLVPLSIALMLWFLLNALARLMVRYSPGGAKLPHLVWMGAALVAVGFVSVFVFDLLAESLSGVSAAAPRYQENILRLADRGAAFFGLEKAPNFSSIAEGIDLKWAVRGVAGFVTTIVGNMGMILLYVIFLSLEQESFGRKLDALFPNAERRTNVRAMLEGMGHRIIDYVWIKTLVSLSTGVISFAILKAVGVDYAVFWGFVIFLLNFIPTIGSLLGVVFPSILALVQFPTVGPFVAVVVLLAVTQFTIGNVIEPKLMGGKLNLSPLVVILSLVLWGKLWGVPGMFLCVPLTVIAMLVMGNFECTRPLAILLSADGEVPFGEEVVGENTGEDVAGGE
jgi:predicted PurR-regulated permease PerM